METQDSVKGLVDRVYQEVRKEFETKIEKLKDENYCLKEELRQRQRDDGNWKGKALYDLLGNSLLKAWWPTEVKVFERPKCDKCDADRRCHFYTPSGMEATEPCECSKKISIYRPEDGWVEEIHQSYSERYGNTTTIYYHNGKKYEWNNKPDSAEVRVSYLYAGEDYKKVKRTLVCFEDEASCQEYCDFLNANKKEQDKLSLSSKSLQYFVRDEK